MKNIIVTAFIILFMLPSISSAENYSYKDWRMNDHDVPLTDSVSHGPNRVIGILACEDKIVLFDKAYSDIETGQAVAARFRIDRGQIYTLTGKITKLDGDYNSLTFSAIETSMFADMLLGNTLRVQFRNRQTQTWAKEEQLIEVYSLQGFQHMVNKSLNMRCPDNGQNHADFFSESTYFDKDTGI